MRVRSASTMPLNASTSGSRSLSPSASSCSSSAPSAMPVAVTAIRRTGRSTRALAYQPTTAPISVTTNAAAAKARREQAQRLVELASGDELEEAAVDRGQRHADADVGDRGETAGLGAGRATPHQLPERRRHVVATHADRRAEPLRTDPDHDDTVRAGLHLGQRTSDVCGVDPERVAHGSGIEVRLLACGRFPSIEEEGTGQLVGRDGQRRGEQERQRGEHDGDPRTQAHSIPCHPSAVRSGARHPRHGSWRCAQSPVAPPTTA